MSLENDARLIATLAQLREPFDRKQIGKLPATAKRPALDYVGHAVVTDRLNRVAPDWTFDIDERFDHNGTCWVRITMTILGCSRPEYGDGSDPKEAIGNAIRRAAMRFGVAVDLWSKEELENVKAAGTGVDGEATPVPADQSPVLGGDAPDGAIPTPSGAGDQGEAGSDTGVRIPASSDYKATLWATYVRLCGDQDLHIVKTFAKAVPGSWKPADLPDKASEQQLETAINSVAESVVA